MTSIRESVRRLLGRADKAEQDKPKPHYSYRIYWTKMVRDWSASRRRQVAARLENVLADEAFEPNTFERRYHVRGLDDSQHAGASLLALQEVLEGFDQFEEKDEESRS